MSCHHPGGDDQGGCYICSAEHERNYEIRLRNQRREEERNRPPYPMQYGRWGREGWHCGCGSDQPFADDCTHCRRCGKYKPNWAQVDAACVVIVRGDKFLCIASEKRGGALGLPGGKSRAGESARETATRECREETGLEAIQLEHLYSARVDGLMVTTFIGYARGDPVSSREGKVLWASRAQLLARSAFREHTAEWLASYDRRW